MEKENYGNLGALEQFVNGQMLSFHPQLQITLPDSKKTMSMT